MSLAVVSDQFPDLRSWRWPFRLEWLLAPSARPAGLALRRAEQQEEHYADVPVRSNRRRVTRATSITGRA